MRRTWLALVSLAVVPACTVDNPSVADTETDGGTDTDTGGSTTGECPAGEEGCACDPTGSCMNGLACENDVCVTPTGECGDGTLDAGEECDDGDANADDAACKSDCTEQFCGDGFVGPREGCDDGNEEDLDECSNTCVAASCGDGTVQAGEQCDDGNADDTDDCPSTCLSATCGDGFVWAGMEECDDGNADETDGCAATCEYAPLCGDGISVAGEVCYLDGTKLDLGAAPWQAKIADVTNDGIADVVVTRANAGGIRVYRGDGAGVLTSDGDFSVNGQFPTDLEVGDFDDDGIMDVAVTTFDSSKTVVLYGTQAQPSDPVVFGTLHDVPALGGGPIGLDVADFNGDGLDDLVITENQVDGNNCYPVGVFHGQGNRSMVLASSAASCVASSGGADVVVGNFTGEANALQLIANRPDVPQLDILQGYDMMTMSVDVNALPAAARPNDMAVGIINNDALADLIVPMFDEATCNYQNDINACDGDEIWLYIGDANDVLFNTAIKVETMTKGVVAAATADITVDGVDDVVVVGQWDGMVTVLANDSIGNLAVAGSFDTTGEEPLSVDAGGDLNGDGVPDIVTANTVSGDITVFLSDP